MAKKASPQTALVLSETANGQILGSVECLFEEYAEKLQGIETISSFVRGKDDLITYFTRGDGYSDFRAKDLFDYKRAKAALDSEFWSKAIEMTDVLQCMSADKRNKWSEEISKNKTPSFERDTVISTIRSLLLSRGSFIADKVDGIFRKLSGTHVTNSPMGFKKRMIIGYVVDKSGYTSHSRTEYIHDLRSVIAKMQCRNEPKGYITQTDIGNIARAKAFGLWHEFDGGAFKVKLFKVGTAHLEVHPDIAAKLNLILASLHPQAIATGARTVSGKEKSIPLYHDILQYEVTEKLSDMARDFDRARNDGGRWAFLSKEELTKQTRKEIEEVLKFLGGSESNGGMWTFDYDVTDVLMEVVRTGRLPEKKSHQFYPTEKALAERVVELANISDEDTILEPSAGHGGIAELLPKKQTTCVEVNSINGHILEKKGFNVQETDFLKWSPSERFSKIVMNPPFAKGAAEMHVAHAVELLSGSGKIVAILPASLRNKTLVKGMTHTWSEVIQRAFEDTAASVVILELERVG